MQNNMCASVRVYMCVACLSYAVHKHNYTVIQCLSLLCFSNVIFNSTQSLLRISFSFVHLCSFCTPLRHAFWQYFFINGHASKASLSGTELKTKGESPTQLLFLLSGQYFSCLSPCQRNLFLDFLAWINVRI